MSEEFDVNIFENLMQKFGCTICTIAPKKQSILEKSYSKDFPEGEIKFYPPLNREMLFVKIKPNNPNKEKGRYILYFGENDLIFRNTKYMFNHLKDIYSFLKTLENDYIMNNYLSDFDVVNKDRIRELYKDLTKRATNK